MTDIAHFAEAVAAVGRAAPTRPVRPEHGAILIDASGDGSILLAASNFETTLRRRISADIATPGTACVSAGLLGAISKTLPRKPLRVERNISKLALSAGSARFGLPLLPDDPPALPVPGTLLATLPVVAFAEAVNRARNALSGADAANLKNLFGIRLEADGRTLSVIATDRYRLAVTTMPCACEPASLLLPADELATAAGAMSGELVTLHADTTFALADGHTIATMRIIDQQYPPWQRLLELPHTTSAAVDSADLLAALARAEIVAGSPPHVTLDIAEDALTVVVAHRGTALGAAADTVPCRLTGAPVTVRINAAYLRQMLHGLGAPRVTMRFAAPVETRPVAGYPSDFDGPLGAPSAFAVMPVR